MPSDPIEFGSNPDPQPCQKGKLEDVTIILVGGDRAPIMGGGGVADSAAVRDTIFWKTSVVDPHWFQCGPDPYPALYFNADPNPGSRNKK